MEEDSDLLHPSPFLPALLQRNRPDYFLYSSFPTVAPCSTPPWDASQRQADRVCRLGEEGMESITILGWLS